MPEAVLASLKVPRKDNGIDIIARDTSGALHAVQCKFLNRPHNARKRGAACYGSKKIHVNWKPLATFRQLVSAAAGPGFQTSAVMTTGDGVTFWGNKPPFEQHICYDAFTALSRSFWYSAARIGPGKTFSPVAFKPRDTSELRAARLRKYQKIEHGSSIPSLPAAAQSASSSSLSTGRAGAAAAAASGGDGGGGETSRCDGAAAPNRATSFASSQSESASPQHGPLLPTSSAPHRWSDPTRGCASKTREEWWITLAKWSNSLRGSMKLRKSIVLGAHEDPRIDLTRTDMERRLEKISQLQQRAERSPNMFDGHSASEGEDSQTPVKRRVLRQRSRSNHEVAVCRFESGTESDESVGGDGGGGGGISGSGSGHERMEIDSENSQPLSQGTPVTLYHPAEQMKSPPTKMKMKFKGQQRRQNRKSLRRGSASHHSPFEVVEEYLELGPGRVRKRNAGTRDPRYLLRCGNYGSVETIAIEMYTIGSDQQHAKIGGGAGGGIVTVGAANGEAEQIVHGR